MSVDARRAKLALPFTIATHPNVLRLVAGEAYRYTLRGHEIHQWGPLLMTAFETGMRVGDALTRLPREHQRAARELVVSLYGERVLIDAPATAEPAPSPPQLVAHGSAQWSGRIPESTGTESLAVFCQDTMDYAAARAFGRAQRAAGTRWIWASTGPLARAYVGPVLLPDAGPCMTCIDRHFARLSPAPEVLEDLHAASTIHRPTPFPAPGIEMLLALIRWKAEALAFAEVPRGVFQLHVIEGANFEVTAHTPMLDPTCPDCARW